jgi:hypothetical protein
MSDTMIFLVGSFVTLVWGSMIGALLYAACNPVKRSDAMGPFEPEKSRFESEAPLPRQSNS